HHECRQHLPGVEELQFPGPSQLVRIRAEGFEFPQNARGMSRGGDDNSRLSRVHAINKELRNRAREGTLVLVKLDRVIMSFCSFHVLPRKTVPVFKTDAVFKADP